MATDTTTRTSDQLQELISTICNHAEQLETLYADGDHTAIASHLAIIFEDSCSAKSKALTLARVDLLAALSKD